MPVQIGLLAETAITKATLERALLVMDVPHVPLQVRRDAEGPVAIEARVRLLARVRPQVTGEVGRTGENLATELAAIALRPVLAGGDRGHLRALIVVAGDERRLAQAVVAEMQLVWPLVVMLVVVVVVVVVVTRDRRRWGCGGGRLTRMARRQSAQTETEPETGQVAGRRTGPLEGMRAGRLIHVRETIRAQGGRRLGQVGQVFRVCGPMRAARLQQARAVLQLTVRPSGPLEERRVVVTLVGRQQGARQLAST